MHQFNFNATECNAIIISNRSSMQDPSQERTSDGGGGGIEVIIPSLCEYGIAIGMALMLCRGDAIAFVSIALQCRASHGYACAHARGNKPPDHNDARTKIGKKERRIMCEFL